MAEVFSESIVDDVYVNAYVASNAKEKLADLAFANSVAFHKMKPITRIYNQSTRLMTALLAQLNLGRLEAKLAPEETEVVILMSKVFGELRESIIKSFTDDRFRLAQELDRAVNSIVSALESYGPFIEVPALPHTEHRGLSSVFRGGKLSSEDEISEGFRDSLVAIGHPEASEDSLESFWTKEIDAETLQAQS